MPHEHRTLDDVESVIICAAIFLLSPLVTVALIELLSDNAALAKAMWRVATIASLCAFALLAGTFRQFELWDEARDRYGKGVDRLDIIECCLRKVINTCLGRT